MKYKKNSVLASGKNVSRARNITSTDIVVVIQILEEWGEQKLTWDALIDEIELRIFCRYTRQALSRYEAICNAFSTAKKTLELKGASNKQRPISATQKTADDRIAFWESKYRHAEKRYEALAWQMATAFYNAGLLGITEERLMRPMPSVDRDKTEI